MSGNYSMLVQVKGGNGRLAEVQEEMFNSGSTVQDRPLCFVRNPHLCVFSLYPECNRQLLQQLSSDVVCRPRCSIAQQLVST